MTQTQSPTRLVSLDQFRGYTVLGMFVVNFVGGLKNVPEILLHHHTYLSYADTIMPQFLFAVGFGMRISFANRLRRDGAYRTYSHFAWRSLGLILLGIVTYHLTGNYNTWDELKAQAPGSALLKAFKRHPFEALTHIGVTTLWVLPVIARPAWVRALFAVISAALHIKLSLSGYYDWNMTSPVGIDGGPLGFLTWTIPLIAGTLVHDWMSGPTRWTLGTILLGIALTALGTSLAFVYNPEATYPFIAPEVKPMLNYWLMSQRAGSVTYLLAGAGIAVLCYFLFHLICDRLRFRLGVLDLLGRHALAGYLVHDMVSSTVRPFCPKDAPLWWVTLCLLVYLGIVFVIIRYLDRNKLWLKL